MYIVPKSCHASLPENWATYLSATFGFEHESDGAIYQQELANK